MKIGVSCHYKCKSAQANRNRRSFILSGYSPRSTTVVLGFPHPNALLRSLYNLCDDETIRHRAYISELGFPTFQTQQLCHVYTNPVN